MFAWDRPVKIEKYDPHTRKVSVTQTTPIEVVSQPNGFRQEDITNSLCIVISELVNTVQAQAKSASLLQQMIQQKQEKKDVKPEPKPKPKRKKTSRRTRRTA